MIGADRFLHNLDDARQKLHVTQRYERGISDIDMWNFDSFLADAIVAACDYYLSDKAATGGPWNKEPEEWKNILTTIRDGFSRRDDAGICQPPRWAWDLLRDNFHGFWD